MFFGIGLVDSVIHAAGSPGDGTSASPNALVVLVKTNARTRFADGRFEQRKRSGDVRVDEGLRTVRCDVRLVQRRGVQYRVDSGHDPLDHGPIGNRADHMS